MKRSPALIFLAALVTVGLTARLGFWQLDRAKQKTERIQAIQARAAQEPLTDKSLAISAVDAQLQWYRRIVLNGSWSVDHTVYLENRPLLGRPGFVVVTPLRLEDGSAILVERGWLPRDPADRTRVAAPPTPTGSVQVEGRIAPGPGRLFEFEAAASGVIRQNVDIQAFATETGLRLRPVSVQQLQAESTADGPVSDVLLRDWPQAASDVFKHHGYAFQWFALSALALCLYVWFQIIVPRRRRRSASAQR